jgi:hypothetical protein
MGARVVLTEACLTARAASGSPTMMATTSAMRILAFRAGSSASPVCCFRPNYGAFGSQAGLALSPRTSTADDDWLMLPVPPR